jgi:exodeoxyribonuclease V gamma subunit
LRHRLGVDLRERETVVGDREPVELDRLERYQLGDVLLGLALDGVEGERLERLARASGLLPPGTPGHLDHRDVMATVAPLADRVRELRRGGRRSDLALALSLADGTRLSGAVGDRWARGVVRHQFARVSGKNVIATWLEHLAFCSAMMGPGESSGEALEGDQPRSYLVGRAASEGKGGVVRTVALTPVADPARHFADLVELYRMGQREPLALFPKSADLFVSAAREGKTDEQALSKALKAWRQNRGWDPHVARVFPDDPAVLTSPTDRLASDFAALARRVFGPIHDHLEPEEDG